MQSNTILTTKKRKVWWYLPYVPAFCFCSEVLGVAIWDINSKKALAGTHKSLSELGLEVDTAMVWGAEAIAGTVALTIILALAMLCLGAGRCMIAWQADRTGATRMGGRLIAWMWLDAAFIFCWHLLLIWHLLLLLGECLWMATCWAMTVAAKVGSSASQSSIALGLSNATITYGDNDKASACKLGCVDLAAYEWVLGNHTCFCQHDKIQTAELSMTQALADMKGSVTGAIIMLIAGIWILMAAAAEFGVTRRERQLLRRIAKARMAGTGETTKLLGGGSGGFAGIKAAFKTTNGKSGHLTQPADALITDPETGEVLEVDGSATGRAQTQPAPSNSSGSVKSMSKSFVKGMGKSLYKTGKVFGAIGSILSPK